MKLVTFEKKRKSTAKKNTPTYQWDRAIASNWGLVLEEQEQIVDLTSTKTPSLLSFIEKGPAVWKDLEILAKKLQKKRSKAHSVLGLNQAQLMTPIPRPSSLRDFLAFEQHSSWSWKKRGLDLPPEWYEMPVYYKGNHRTLFGPNDLIPSPAYTEKMDYELELAMVVGRRGIDIPKEKAIDYIFGYSILNDWSARDIQAKEMICRLGPAKGKDFATSIGPCLVTKTELGDAQNLCMQAFINGEKWSEGNSGSSHWSFSDMIAHVSRCEPVFPGDIYGSGTVGRGCGLELDRWIQPGDHVALSIEGIGTLENKISKVKGKSSK